MPLNSVPVLTIGLPVYNGERFLDAAIDSVLGQTFGDFILIISDNASTDATEEICRAASKRDKRVQYYRHETNQGGAWNFNFVARKANSPLFRFAAHDDLLDPRLLERCLQAVEDEPHAVLWYPRTVEIDEEGQEVRAFSNSLALSESRPHLRLRKFLDAYENSNALFGLIRHEVLLTTRLHGTYNSADITLLAELALRGRFIEVPEQLFRRRWEVRSTGPQRSYKEISHWYDPGRERTRQFAFMRTRLFIEIPYSVIRAPIPAHEKVLSITQFARSWVPKHGRAVLGEMKRAALTLSGRAPTR